MKLRFKNAYSEYQRNSKYSVDSATDHKLSDTYADGTLEILREEIRNQRELISVLVELLYEAKVLSKEDVLLKLLNDNFEEIEEN